ncbi:glycoside hydrolase family 3 protein [Actinosynnema pretiosum subsp. pretiosum]|uniref:beta-N-acetylhexosaminidase n=1 Tax=Actinosynnema pretiosum subsp. pretiosum TaxID=103721 RepID=A0AA45L746_9PSEU|nr:Beta-hexosaminidase [Actinosynnema pretiosum subsp. pretiosum]QUF04571.1 glycoside hydrolase family 3 protein [Actinosynnema pretiosum subsp. pretiosum]
MEQHGRDPRRSPARRGASAAKLGSVALGAVLAASVLTGVALNRDDTVTGAAVPEGGTTETGETTTTTTTSTPPPDPCAPVLAGLTPRAGLAQLLQVGVNPRGPQDALSIVGSEQVGGIFVGGDDVGLLSGDALAAVHAASTLPLTVSVDDEGGRVQRIDALDGDIPSARTMTRTLSTEQVRELARKRGEAMKARGVNTDLAPVLDLTSQAANTVIGDRSFSADPATAVSYAEAFAEGLRQAGVVSVVKHFPGHGNTSGDSHLGSVTAPPLAQLRAHDLAPYRELPRFGEDVQVMVGHIAVPDLTGGLPASLSPAAYELLRGEFAFDGLVMTDDLGAMRAVTDLADLPDAVLRALVAGADVALWSSGGRVGEVLDRLQAAVASGELSAERVDRSLRRVLKSKHLC